VETSRLIEEIEKLVEETCKKETNIFGYTIWSHHIKDVIKYGKMLADKLGADIEIVEISALLHDYAGIKDKSLHENHHIHGAIEAEKILLGLGYPEEKIEKVKHCIVSHRGSINSDRLTQEAVCVASADAMAHIAQVPSLFYLVYCRHGMNVDEGAHWVKSKIERSWNKLCPEAKELIKDTYIGAKQILF